MKRTKRILTILICMVMGVFLISTPLTAKALSSVTLNEEGFIGSLGTYDGSTSDHKFYYELKDGPVGAKVNVTLTCQNIRNYKSKTIVVSAQLGKVSSIDLPYTGGYTTIFANYISWPSYGTKELVYEID